MNVLKKRIGILVDPNGQSFVYARELNNNGLGAVIFNSSTDLFEAILKNKLDIIVIDSELITEDVIMISRYRIMSPNLLIVMLGQTNDKKTAYLIADCDFFLNSSDLISLIGYLYVLLKRRPSEATDSVEYTNKPLSLTDKNLAVDLTLNDSWRLSIIDYHLHAPNGTLIKLTMREFNFLMLLFHCNDTVVTKADIVRDVIGRNYDTSDQRIALLVTRLRKKILRLASIAIPIKSDYTNGYLFAGNGVIEKREVLCYPENKVEGKKSCWTEDCVPIVI